MYTMAGNDYTIFVCTQTHVHTKLFKINWYATEAAVIGERDCGSSGKTASNIVANVKPV